MARSKAERIKSYSQKHIKMTTLLQRYFVAINAASYDNTAAGICPRPAFYSLVYLRSHITVEYHFISIELWHKEHRRVYDTLVCLANSYHVLLGFFRLVCIGKEIPEESVGERLNFGVELQKAFTEFVNNFIPHMEEEEQVFQPLLVEHFEYAELKVLKEVVLEQHQLVKEQVTEKHLTDHPETNQEIKDLRDADHLDCSQLTSAISQLETGTQLEKETFQVWEEKDQKYMYTTNDELGPEGAEYEWNDTGENCKKDDLDSTLNVVNYEDDICKTPKLPPELLCEIFSYLNPPDMGHCAQVCWTWNAAVYSPALWKSLYPIQWARGIWQCKNMELGNVLESDAWSGCGEGYKKHDEDADVDETEQNLDSLAAKEHHILESLVTWVLPNVGSGVTTMILDAGTGVSSRLINQSLILCPNIKHLSAAYTKLDYYAFKGLAAQWSLLHLEHLDLQGCDQVDDTVLECLAQCAEVRKPLQQHTPNNAATQCQYFYPHHPLQDSRNYPDVKSLGLGNDVGGWCGVDGSYDCSRSSCFNNSYGCPKLQINYSTRASLSFTNFPNNMHPNNDNYFNIFPQQQAPAYERDIEEICCAPHLYNIKHTALAAPQLYKAGIPLVHLNLSGCWRVTDEGLYALSDTGITEKLSFLDLSGLYQVSGECLEIVSETCSELQPKNLSYCDNIVDGPYKTEANCCGNLNHPLRACCRMGT
ncbi:unnamed protein product, partial [Meganyctiphanes norvegica]